MKGMAQEADRLFNDLFQKVRVCFEVGHNANMRCGALIRLLKEKGTTDEEIAKAFTAEMEALREFQAKAAAARQAHEEELKQEKLQEGVEAIKSPQPQEEAPPANVIDPEPLVAEGKGVEFQPLIFGGDYVLEESPETPPPSLDSTTS